MRHTIPFAALMLLPLFGCSPHKEEAVQTPPAPVRADAAPAKASTPTSAPATTPAEQFTSVKVASNSAVEVLVSFEPEAVKPGQSVQCVAKFKIGSGWHIYAMKGGAGPSQPTRLKLELPAWIKEQGEWIAPQPQINLSHFGPEMIHTGEISITRNFTLGSDAPTGLQHIPCSISLQACDASRCLPPETFSLSLPITVTSE